MKKDSILKLLPLICIGIYSVIFGYMAIAKIIAIYDPLFKLSLILIVGSGVYISIFDKDN